MKNKEVLEKIEKLKVRLKRAESEKVELEFELKNLEKEKVEVESKVEETFGTVDIEELKKIKDDLVKEFEEVS